MQGSLHCLSGEAAEAPLFRHLYEPAVSFGNLRRDGPGGGVHEDQARDPVGRLSDDLAGHITAHGKADQNECRGRRVEQPLGDLLKGSILAQVGKLAVA